MNRILLCLAILLPIGAFAHSLHGPDEILHRWTVPGTEQTMEGSFFMFKNDEVYIEDRHGRLVHFPLRSLSAEDQTFAMEKAAWVQQINDRLKQQSAAAASKSAAFWSKAGPLLGILSLIGLVFLLNAGGRKRAYFAPLLTVGVLMSAFGFKEHGIMMPQSTTDPLYVDSAFAPFKPNVSTSWDNNWFYVESRGIPAHQMMVGISNHGWQQQVPIPQCYNGANSWQIPLNPVIANNKIPVDSIHFTRGAIALAANGVPIFNVHTNTGVDSYLDGQLDNFGGHCGRADDYHYHIAPLHLYGQIAPTRPCAYALDGFAVYGALEPDGTVMHPLDSNHGHFGPNGAYHYHGTVSAPYMIKNMVGQVTEDGTHQLIPQPHATPVRPALTPLPGALITGCHPNAAGNGYTLVYTLNNVTDSIVYDWTNTGVYTFRFYTANGQTTSTYNGFIPCQPLPTGTEEPAADNGVVMYPNPATNTFSFYLGNGLRPSDVREITLYDALGKVVFSSNRYQPNIDVRSMAKGVYFVSIRTDSGRSTQKLLIE